MIEENHCADLKASDIIVFEDDPDGERFVVTSVDRGYERVYFFSINCLPKLCPGMTRCMNVKVWHPNIKEPPPPNEG